MNKMLTRKLHSHCLKNHSEKQYLNLISDIIFKGHAKKGRNGLVYSKTGASMRFSLENNTMPLITTKKVAWKTCLKELLWFIKGDTNNEILQKQNVKIWNDNADRAFLDSRKLFHLNENDLGPVYGHQWRFFNANYNTCNDDYTNQGVDQLQNIIDILKNKDERHSRRIIMSAWNPQQIDEMALPPCHVLSQFCVNDNKLSCILYQRSGDIGLGIPFNIASYSFLTHILAKHCGLNAYEFIHFIGDAHIYSNHVIELKKQLLREPYKFPTLDILNIHENIEDYSLDDIIIKNYKSHKKINMTMTA
jgi:thymidylate synthase